VTAQTYVRTSGKKAGMVYARVTKGTPPGQLDFTSPIKGKFTRYVFCSGKTCYAEISK
jgi:hypothetical protein